MYELLTDKSLQAKSGFDFLSDPLAANIHRMCSYFTICVKCHDKILQSSNAKQGNVLLIDSPVGVSHRRRKSCSYSVAYRYFRAITQQRGWQMNLHLCSPLRSLERVSNWTLLAAELSLSEAALEDKWWQPRRLLYELCASVIFNFIIPAAVI